MSLEQAAIAALGIIWGCLVWMFKAERQNSIQREKACQETNARLEDKLRDVAQEVGTVRGQLEMFERCRVEACPFTDEEKRALSRASRVAKDKERRRLES
jgi:Flp pilus assembly protein TadB